MPATIVIPESDRLPQSDSLPGTPGIPGPELTAATGPRDHDHGIGAPGIGAWRLRPCWSSGWGLVVGTEREPVDLRVEPFHRLHVGLLQAQDRLWPTEEHDPAVLLLHVVYVLERLPDDLLIVSVNHPVRSHRQYSFESARCPGKHFGSDSSIGDSSTHPTPAPNP